MTTNEQEQRQRNRYWGERPVPTAKVDFFNAITTPGSSSTGGSDGGTVATIRMYGPIDSWGGFWGISTRDMGAVLDALPDSVEQIILRINSPGGEVFEGMSILNMLRAHSAKVTAVVDGLAASAASVIAAGADETVMSPGTQMMIHKASSIVWGNADDMRKSAKVLDSIDASLIEIYTGKAGEADWESMLADDTWMTAAEAVATKLADRVAVIPDAGESATVGDDEEDEVLLLPDEEDPEDVAAAIPLRIVNRARVWADVLAANSITSGALAANSVTVGDTTIRITPGDIAAATTNSRTRLDASRVTRPAEPGTTSTTDQKGVAMSDYSTEVRNRLGLPAEGDITDEAFLAAVARTGSAPSIPEGMSLIEDATLEQMRTNADLGRQAFEAQAVERRTKLVEDAIDDGRISVSRRDHWIASLEADEEGQGAVLASLAKGLVPVKAKAATGGIDESSDDDKVYDKVAARFGGAPNTKEA